MINTVIQALRTTYMIEEENGMSSVCIFPLQGKEAVHHHLVSCHKCLESQITQEGGLFFNSFFCFSLQLLC